MSEEQLKSMCEKLTTGVPFVLVYADKKDANVSFNFHSSKLDGPTLAYMSALIQTNLMQGLIAATTPAVPNAPEAPPFEKVAE